jgi:ribosomal protein L20
MNIDTNKNTKIKSTSTFTNWFLFLCCLSVTTYANTSLSVPSLSLIPLQGDSNKGSIEIRPFEGSRQGLVSIQEGKGLKENIYVVELRKRAGADYHLSSIDTKKIVVTKTSALIMNEGSQKFIFDVFMANGKKIRAIASKDSGVKVLQRYKESEFSHETSLTEVFKAFKASCAKSPQVKWGNDLTKRDKKRSIHLLRVMAETCASDKEYKEAIGNLSSIDISLNDKKRPSMRIDKKNLYLGLSKANYILEHFSRKWLLENL